MKKVKLKCEGSNHSQTGVRLSFNKTVSFHVLHLLKCSLIHNNKDQKTPFESLDNLLESIAFENFTTNIHLTEILNGGVTEAKATNNNNNINNKTDTLNRYFDNLINFNRECEKANLRKSESSSDHSSSSDQQNNNGRLPYRQVRTSLNHFIANVIIIKRKIRLNFFCCLIRHVHVNVYIN